MRADKVHERLEAMGYEGSPRTTRRAVARAKAAYEAGHRRVLQPWVTEPGLWMQWDYGAWPSGGQFPATQGQIGGGPLFNRQKWSGFQPALTPFNPTEIGCLERFRFVRGVGMHRQRCRRELRRPRESRPRYLALPPRSPQ